MATKKINRDAGDGRFVTKKYAQNNPRTTVQETVKTTKPNKKK